MNIADRTKSINLELLEEMFQIEEKEKAVNAGKAPSALIRFQTKTELFCTLLKEICVRLSFSYRFRPSTLQRRIRFENAFIPSANSAHAQMNSTHAHFNILAREIGAILDSVLLSVVVV